MAQLVDFPAMHLPPAPNPPHAPTVDSFSGTSRQGRSFCGRLERIKEQVSTH